MNPTTKAIDVVLAVLRGLAIAVVVAIVVVPIGWIILTAFKPLESVYTMSLLFTPTMDNFFTIFEGPFFVGDRLLNSAVISIFTVAIGVPVALAAAYSFSRFQLRFKGGLFFGVLATQFVPGVVIALPFFLMYRNLGLLDTWAGMIWVNLSLVLPFAIWLLKGFVDTIPIEMEEAAMVDGASRLRILWQIVVPVSIPGLSVAAIFCFLLSWNDLLFALVLTRREAATLPVALSSFYTEEGERWELIAATGTFILLPIFAVSYFIQRHFVSGTTAGAQK